MVSAVARTYICGGLGALPQWGPGAKPWSGGLCPPEAEAYIIIAGIISA
jgi:hypothetical protein